MLNQLDIDTLMQTIQNGREAFVYYIAHNVELREGYIDELAYKSNPKFRILKLKVTGITNALWEVQNYLSRPNNYHVEEEESYPSPNYKYVNYFIVPNNASSYSAPFNARMPSAIYGVRRRLFDSSGRQIGSDTTDPSPVKEVYTNELWYGNTQYSSLPSTLSWKYKSISSTNVDGITYRYLTSDWFILDIANFLRTEKVLINVKQKTAYFMTLEAAYNCMKELMA